LFLAVLVSVLAIGVAAPEAVDQALGVACERPGLESSFVAAWSPASGALRRVVRRWRWVFWLLVVPFWLVLRVPAVIVHLTGVLAGDAPAW
jgi:hypothetical protein